MRRRVRLSGPAAADLLDILTYLAAESPRAAETIADQLDDAIADLADSSDHFAVVTSRPESRLRRRVVGAYNIFYRADRELVTVMRILHGARNATHLLFPDT